MAAVLVLGGACAACAAITGLDDFKLTEGGNISSNTASGAGGAGSAGTGGASGGGQGQGGSGGQGTGGTGGGGAVGYSLRFSSGDGSYVEVPGLTIPQDFTVEAWVKRAAGTINGERCLLAKDRRNQGPFAFRLVLEDSGQIAFMMTNASGQDGGLYSNGYRIRSSSTLAEDTWTHVAVTKGGLDWRLYVNGAQEVAYTATINLVHGGTQPFRIGARVATDGIGPDNIFNGQLDEVRIWNVARTDAEVYGGMNQAPGSSMGLVAFYALDEGAGGVASDREGAYDGVLINAPEWVQDDAVP